MTIGPIIFTIAINNEDSNDPEKIARNIKENQINDKISWIYTLQHLHFSSLLDGLNKASYCDSKRNVIWIEGIFIVVSHYSHILTWLCACACLTKTLSFCILKSYGPGIMLTYSIVVCHVQCRYL